MQPSDRSGKEHGACLMLADKQMLFPSWPIMLLALTATVNFLEPFSLQQLYASCKRMCKPLVRHLFRASTSPFAWG